MAKNPRRNSDDFVKAKVTKRSSDVWNEAALEEAEVEESRWENFVRERDRRPEGMAPDVDRLSLPFRSKMLYPDKE